MSRTTIFKGVVFWLWVLQAIHDRKHRYESIVEPISRSMTITSMLRDVCSCKKSSGDVCERYPCGWCANILDWISLWYFQRWLAGNGEWCFQFAVDGCDWKKVELVRWNPLYCVHFWEGHPSKHRRFRFLVLPSISRSSKEASKRRQIESCTPPCPNKNNNKKHTALEQTTP